MMVGLIKRRLLRMLKEKKKAVKMQDQFHKGKRHLIKLFAEAKVCKHNVTARIQEDILKFQVPIDNAELQEKREDRK